MRLLKYTRILFGIISLIIGVSSCETNRDEIMAIGPKKIMPSQTGKDITMLYTDSAMLKVRLEAPQMLMYDKGIKEPMTIMPKGLRVVFLDNKGKETTTLKANYGINYETSRRMEARYNVEVVNANGEKLNTEHLVWDENTRQITSDAFVKITTAKEIIMGKGLKSNQDFTQYEILEITGTLRVEDNQM
ncbi:MAG: LPS export ABC transporter periplasmic protein LptC [Bacteroidota bacterium]